jgi:N-succinyldiaminopimelate aminotransferase
MMISSSVTIMPQPAQLRAVNSLSTSSKVIPNTQSPISLFKDPALRQEKIEPDVVKQDSKKNQVLPEAAGTPGFRKVPKTGVIFVSEKAEKYGWYAGNPEWSNLGQGMPETGPIKGAPPPIDTVSFDDKLREYGPVPGIMDLRKAVAEFYNNVYRKNKDSKYTADNVCIVGGGRLALARLAASLGNVNIGHVIPDYTAYEDLLTVFRTFTPIPLLLDREQGFKINAKELRKEINGRGLSALLFSNPNNPTGALTEGPDLAACVDVARDMGCSLIIDEIYSHYIWTVDSGVGDQTWKMVSAAQYVQDVNKDPVVILDGLTKNWRLPGWRCCWILGPADVIQSVSATGSFMDGGASGAICRAALPLLQVDHVIQDCKALQKEFLGKRRYLMVRSDVAASSS